MMQNIATMIIIKLTQLRCVLIAQSSNVLIVIRKSILVIEQKNEVTLQYPGGLTDTDEFRICVRSNNYDESACGTGYNTRKDAINHY